MEQYEVVVKALPGLVDFLLERQHESPSATVAGMLAILRGPDAHRFVLELHTLAAIGRRLGDICYEIEGDGPLIFSTYELYLRAVNILLADSRLPDPLLDQVRRMSVVNGALNEELFHANIAICRAVIAPAREYLAGQALKSVVSRSIHVAKVAAMWNPLKVHGMSLNESMLRVRHLSPHSPQNPLIHHSY